MSARVGQTLPADAYLTVAEVAVRLQISRWKVYELIRSRELASFLVGRCRRIPASAVDDMVARLLDEAA
jgi:excisionase family DNA binding protein